MTALHTLDETESSQQRPQVIETNVGVRSTAKNLEQELLAHKLDYGAIRTCWSAPLRAVPRRALPPVDRRQPDPGRHTPSDSDFFAGFISGNQAPAAFDVMPVSLRASTECLIFSVPLRHFARDHTRAQES